MGQSGSAMAQQLAQAASAFEQRLTGHAPRSVTVVLSGDTLVITLHGALSPAEKDLAQNPAGAAQVQELHRQLFNNSFDSLRQEIKRITGVEVREATAEVATATGTVVKAFTTGTVVQVFSLAGSVPAETWTEVGQATDHEKGGSAMLVLSRKRQEVVVVGGPDGFGPMLRVTVLDIKGGTVRLGFEADADVSVHRLEVWEQIRAATRPDSPGGGPAAPVG